MVLTNTARPGSESSRPAPFGGGQVRPDEVEAGLDPVVGPVSDQDDQQQRIGRHAPAERVHGGVDAGAGGAPDSRTGGFPQHDQMVVPKARLVAQRFDQGLPPRGIRLDVLRAA